MSRALKYEKKERPKKVKCSWVNRGLYLACDCFSCANKVDHEMREFHVRVLCKDHCNYVPKEMDAGPVTKASELVM